MPVDNYAEFLASKRMTVHATGPIVDNADIHPALFPFQRDLVRWAVRKGRAALFADTGLGKTAMQVEWSRQIRERALILAPLSVARQTVSEARRILGVDVHYTRSGDDLADGINITNYEMMERFDPNAFGAVVLDESSILKALDGKTRQRLTEMFAGTPYKLCCTATPAPNDITEIANHAEFLGYTTRANMLATFFVHDSDSTAENGWRLKRHAETAFYRWLASWGMSIRKPSDLGYSDDGYTLPPLTIQPVFVKTEYSLDVNNQMAFVPMGLKGITDRAKVRRGTLEERVTAAAAVVNRDSEQWIVWCGLNDESALLAKMIPDGVEVKGSDSPDTKAAALEAFQSGKHRVLISKVAICGFGMNFQNAHKMVFVGLGDSFEQYYQAIRRCYRFGQKKAVEVYIVLSELEEPIYRNVLRKEAEARKMSEKLIANVKEFEREEMAEISERVDYNPQVAMKVPTWLGAGA